MMSLDSHITLAVIFSFFGMLGQGFSIYAIVHSKQTEDTNKEITNVEQFVAINYKLDEVCRNQAALMKNSDKTTEIVTDIQKELISINHTLDDHESRITRLEETK